MLKQILNLDGAQELSKKEQKSIAGGKLACKTHADCPSLDPCPVVGPCDPPPTQSYGSIGYCNGSFCDGQTLVIC